MNKEIHWINANAGSGKTTFLIHTIQEYLKQPNSQLNHILCLTFSNTAAKEINHRILNQHDANDTQTQFYPVSYTLHAFCYQLLLKHNPNYQILHSPLKQILWEKSLNQALKTYEQDLTDKLNDKQLEELHLLKTYTTKQHQGILGKIQQKALEHMNQMKTLECLIDFDDILDQTIKLLQSSIAGELIMQSLGNIKFLLIDEAQDLSSKQWKVIFALVQELTQQTQYHIYVVGDEKQSIYSFQGACLESYHQAKKALEEITRYISQELNDQVLFQEHQLQTTYRCPEVVCKFVDRLFHNKLQSTHQSNHKQGKIIFTPLLTEKEWMQEILEKIRDYIKQGIEPKDILILIRKRQARFHKLEALLLENGIETEYEHTSLLADILIHYIQFILEPNDHNAYQTLNLIDPTKAQFLLLNNQLTAHLQTWPTDSNPMQLLEKTMQFLHVKNDFLLSQVAQNIQTTSLKELLDFLQTMPTKNTQNKTSVRIQTIHQAKGQEAKVVFLCDTTLNPNQAPLDFITNNNRIISSLHEQYETAKDEHRTQLLAEHHRLLYVALTRTKHDLIIVNYPYSPDKSPEPENVAQNAWYHALEQTYNNMS